MTIKNILQRSSQTVSLNTSRSDMQKRGAVRNLFNATPDRKELKIQIEQLEQENCRELKRYKVDSIIGVIKSATEDKDRKLKRWSRCLESSDDESDDQPQRPASTTRELPENSSDNTSSPTPSTSSKKSELKIVQRSIPLAKRQPSIKDFFPVSKRRR